MVKWPLGNGIPPPFVPDGYPDTGDLDQSRHQLMERKLAPARGSTGVKVGAYITFLLRADDGQSGSYVQGEQPAGAIYEIGCGPKLASRSV